MRTATIALLIIAALLLAAAQSYSQLSTSGRPPIPKMTSPVYDETGTLSAEEIASLVSKLRRFEDSTSTQVAIMIIKTLDGYPASDFAIEASQENKIGQAKKNNGALIMLAKNDRKGFIATGYGLEPTLTDAMCSQIYRQILTPALKRNDYYGGLSRSIDAIEQAIGGEFKAEPKSRKGREGGGALIWVVLLFVAFIVLRALFGTGTRRTVVGSGGGGSGCMGGMLQGLFLSSLISSIGRGSSHSGFGGGGFGGGSSGGWSGGGGSFGGGGAGGDW